MDRQEIENSIDEFDILKLDSHLSDIGRSRVKKLYDFIYDIYQIGYSEGYRDKGIEE